MFEDIIHMGLNGLEKAGNIIGYDLEDMTKELMNDPEFQYDLKII
jgi:hypothetical protein